MVCTDAVVCWAGVDPEEDENKKYVCFLETTYPSIANRFSRIQTTQLLWLYNGREQHATCVSWCLRSGSANKLGTERTALWIWTEIIRGYIYKSCERGVQLAYWTGSWVLTDLGNWEAVIDIRKNLEQFEREQKTDISTPVEASYTCYIGSICESYLYNCWKWIAYQVCKEVGRTH